MATLPMQEESGQEIYTRDHGTVKVDKNSWIDGGLHVVLSPNGVYQHINGLPIKDEEELHRAFGTNLDALAKALDWFRNRHEQTLNPPRPIGFRPDNCPVFEDGSIPEESDLYNYFSPGPVLSAAIVGLHEYRQRQETGQAPQQARPAPMASAPKPEVDLSDVVEKLKTAQKELEIAKAGRIAAEKALKAKKSKKTATAATSPKPAPQTATG